MFIDSNNDGIGDEPYPIDGGLNTDENPAMTVTSHFNILETRTINNQSSQSSTDGQDTSWSLGLILSAITLIGYRKVKRRNI